jgi:hypothetical protein
LGQARNHRWGLLIAVGLLGLAALSPAAIALPPAAKQYLPVIPTANGPQGVHSSAPVARPEQLSPAARAALKGSTGADLRRIATATALGAPAQAGPGDPARVEGARPEGARPGFLSATFDALGQGAVLALIAAFALVTGLLVYLGRSGRDVETGSPTS